MSKCSSLDQGSDVVHVVLELQNGWSHPLAMPPEPALGRKL